MYIEFLKTKLKSSLSQQVQAKHLIKKIMKET